MENSPSQYTYDFLTTADNTFLRNFNSNYANPSFLAGNVAKTKNDQTTTYYSYDVYGRVQWLVQDIKDLGTKTIDYEYDPVSGQVTSVIYQKHKDDEYFEHIYEYNELQQLVRVLTAPSRGYLPPTLRQNGNKKGDSKSAYKHDYIYKQKTIHANYTYYETAALKRVELADGIQGIDYVYNLQGQLKAINHPNLTKSDDPGGDDSDLFGMTLDYYSGDYVR